MAAVFDLAKIIKIPICFGKIFLVTLLGLIFEEIIMSRNKPGYILGANDIRKFGYIFCLSFGGHIGFSWYI